MSGPTPPISPPVNALIAQQAESLTRLDAAEASIAATAIDLAAKQPLDADLTAISGLTFSDDDFLQRKAGALANRTIAQVKTDLSLAGTNTGDQTNIAGNAAGSDADAAADLALHAAVTTGAHGIPDPSTLVVTSDARLSDARTPVAHNHSAADITSGTMDQARLGTGSGGAGAKYLADDQTYKAVTAAAADEWIRQAAARTLTNTTAVQKIFDSVANGTLTLATGVYSFKAMFGVTGMSGTSGNAQFSLLGAGTATLAAIIFGGVGIDSGGIGNVTTITGSASVTGSSGASALTAGTGTTMWFQVEGEFDCTVAGTLIPSIALVTAVAATLVAGSYFSCLRKAATGAVSFGNWS